jgi:hypothetical protein
VGQFFVVGQVLVYGSGGDLRVTLAELVYEQLVRVAPPVVLTGVRIEQPETDPHVPFVRPLAHRRKEGRRRPLWVSGVNRSIWGGHYLR